MISDGTIVSLCAVERPLVYVPVERAEFWGSLCDDQIQPASVDVRLAQDILLYDHEVQPTINLAPEEFLWLPAGECALGSLIERVQIPDDMVGWVEGKSSIGRQFLKVHSAGFIDPGFHGDITLEIKNESSKWAFRLTPGLRIAQLRFAYLDAIALRPYGSEYLNSHYQNQHGTTEARK